MTLLNFTGSYADDAGDKTSGTVVDKAFFVSIQSAIDALIHSTTNPTVDANDIIDEVVAARGSEASLDARLDVSLNEDGTLKTQASLVTVTDAQRLTAVRDLAKNGRLDQWTGGGAVAPDNFTLSGTGAAVERTGNGETDTEDLGTNHKAAKITFGSTAAKLTQIVVAAADFGEHHDLRGRKVSVVVRSKASVANLARIVVDDGVTQTASSFHTGGGAVEKLTATHTLSGTATKIDVYFEVAVAGSAYFTKMSVAFTDLGLEDWIPFGGGDEASATQIGTVNLSDQVLGAGQKTIGTKVPLFNPGTTEIATTAIVSGVLDLNVTSVSTTGNPIEDLMTYTLPANVLDHDGAAIRIKAWGVLANDTDQKDITLEFGATAATLISHNVANTPNWEVEALIVRTGVGAQLFLARGFLSTSTAGTVGVRDSRATPAEDETGTIVVRFRGDGINAGDITQQGMLIEVVN